MSLRFRRSIKIAPGIRVNFGKTGASVSAGARGASMTFGKRGVYANVGIPGSGLSFRNRIDDSKGKSYTEPHVASGCESNVKIRFDLHDDGTIKVYDAEGNLLPDKFIRIAREQKQDVFDQWLLNMCDQLNTDVDKILNIHLLTPVPNESRDFVRKSFIVPEPVFTSPEVPKYQKIGFFAKVFRFLKERREKENELIRDKYEKEKEIEKIAFDKAYRDWQTQKSTFDDEQNRKYFIYAEGRFKDTELMGEYLEDVLNDLCWPRETIVSFDIQNDGHKVIIDVDLPEIEEMPQNYASVAKNHLKLNVKKRSDTQLRRDYMMHVHAIGFLVIGEVFVSLAKVQHIVLSAFSQRLNSGTGVTSNEYLYSVRADRLKWELINFKNLPQIDVVECFGNFEILRNMSKTGIFKPIEPFAD